MEVKHFKGIDYEFRPKSYWDIFDDPLQAILNNVKGTNRRQMIRDYWEAGRIEELFDTHLLDELGEEERSRLGQIHPSFMGGEYLPGYADGEVEIARIELQSTTADVISIRARKEGERIAYLIVDEYETEFNILPTHSDKPLTLAELVRLIDGAMEEGSLGLYYTQMNYEAGERSIEWLDQMRHFTRVDSVFYPQLWHEREKSKLLAQSDNTAS